MGSILSEMYQTDVNSTLQILGEHGVTAEDLKFFRKYRTAFAGSVAEILKKGRALFEQAITSEPTGRRKAIWAVEEIKDPEILKKIYEVSPFPEVWAAVMKTMKDQSEIYHLVRIYSDDNRREARLIGARKLSSYRLALLGDDDGYLRLEELKERRSIVKQVEEERLERSKSARQERLQANEDHERQ